MITKIYFKQSRCLYKHISTLRESLVELEARVSRYNEAIFHRKTTKHDPEYLRMATKMQKPESLQVVWFI